MRSFKKYVVSLVALSMVAFLGYGCDTDRVCTDTVVVTGAMSAKVFYPCNLSEPVGATTVMSGFIGTKESVAWLARPIAEAGYVALSITPLNPYGLVSGWRTAHKGGITRLKALARSGRLAGKIDTNKLAVCGHSKGGGGALWASADLGNELAATIPMAPYNGDISGTGVATEGPQGVKISTIKSPTFIQAGSADTLATNIMTRAEYRYLPGNIEKCYHEYPGYGHMAWATGGPNQKDTLARDVIAWLKLQFDGIGSGPNVCR